MNLKKSEKKIFDKTFIKFVIVGVLNTAVGTGIMFTMYNIFHFSYWISTAANYIVGSIVSYFLNKYFTFKSTEKGIKPVIRFIINILVCYLLAYGMARPLVRFIMSESTEGVRENCAMFFGMILFVFLNYFGQKFFAFKKNEE